MTPAQLRHDTQVERVRSTPGLYTAELSDDWSYLNPSGGVVAAIALRAMTAELDTPELTLVSATTQFCQAIVAGPVRVEVEKRRQSERAAQLRARLSQPTRPGAGVEVLATFGRVQPGPDVHGAEMPVVAPPTGEARGISPFEPASAPFAFYRNFEMRLGFGEPLGSADWQKGPAHTAVWYRYLQRPHDARGELDPLALPAIADTIPPALRRRLGPEYPRFIAPSLDLTVFFLAPTRSEWILVEAFAERARSGYAVGSANLWDEQGALVARAAQSMILIPLDAQGART